ncbi:hypothetical protein L2E82_01173 [Cichorium intybus]|uniref:Uncharacterized protein n=1 Tax=Cichorium intybus TaxID=13427 RepID=A0ACB9GXV3_CICIN|nr:hypothetical protein L2E82_01173 [Cichorium intybus]
MELKSGLSALVTGGASGIGRALCIALAQKGIFVTVVDNSAERGEEVASISQEENLKFHSGLKFTSAIFVRCDVSKKGELAAAFEKHMEVFGSLDICINCVTSAPFHDDQTDGAGSLRDAINVDLLAVIDCTHKAIKMMEAAKKPGVVINVGPASAVNTDFIYSAAKGCQFIAANIDSLSTLFICSNLIWKGSEVELSSYKEKGIRINVLCPQFVRSEMTEILGSQIIEHMGGYVSMDTLIQGAFELISDASKAGSCLYITNSGGLEYRSTPTKESKYLVVPSRLNKRFSIVHTLSHNFLSATSIVRATLKLPIKPDHVLLKIIYVGVNASDVNYTSGRYFSGSEEEISTLLPLDAGLEAVGLIAAVGDDVKNLEVGTPAAIMNYGAYAEFAMVPAELVLRVNRPDPEVVAMLISGLTASVALEKAAQMESGKTVLVTAAAGGTGQFAVQVAKLAGNKVVATCGGKDKATLLRDLGVDRVINYKEESIENAGFNLWYYKQLWQKHLDNLVHLFSIGKLKVAIDPKSFVGLQSVADALEYIHSGKSIGKVIVCIDPSFSQKVTN